MTVPNFYVIGASKCGTTSLYHYLAEHPDIFLPQEKELHFHSFKSLKNMTGGPGDQEVVDSCCKNIDTYIGNFNDSRPDQLTGDCSPSYFFHHTSADSILKTSGKAKCILVLRNPVSKIYSQYLHLIRNGRETLEFPEALGTEPNRKSDNYSDMWLYKESGMYNEKVQHFKEKMGAENLKVVLFEDFSRNTKSTMTELFEFLELNPEKANVNFDVYNKGGSIPRFGDLTLSILNNQRAIDAVNKLLPALWANKIKNSIKSVILKPALEKPDNLKKQYIHLFRDDIIELEKTLNKKTNWL